MQWGGGAHLTKSGWSKPHTHSNPNNLTLFRFNQGAHTITGGLKWEQGAEPPSLPHFNHCMSLIKEIRRKILTPRVPPFKLTESHCITKMY